MATKEEMGERLRAERGRLGLTQPQLAELCEVSKTTQHNYESGQRVPDAVYLAAAFGIGVDVLYVITGQRNPVVRSRSSDALEDSYLAGIKVRFAEEPTPSWAPSLPDANPDTTQMRGDLPIAPRPAELGSALLPFTGKQAACPLVISLPVGAITAQGDKQPSRHEYQVIPRRTRAAGASRQSNPFSQPPDQIDLAGDLVFSFDWLQRNLGDTTGPLTSMQVAGRSMEPTLADGETIVIDEGVSSIQLDGIYVFESGGVRRVKRVQRMIDGGLTLISDNSAYQRETIDRAEARNVRVLGMVVWPRIR